MAQSFHLHEQAERCRRLVRDSIDPMLQDRLFKLADEYAARAGAGKDDDTAGWRASPDDQGAA